MAAFTYSVSYGAVRVVPGVVPGGGEGLSLAVVARDAGLDAQQTRLPGLPHRLHSENMPSKK